MGQNIPQLASNDIGDIPFALWAHSHYVWNSPTVRSILEQSAVVPFSLCCLFVEKKLLLDKNFFFRRTSWSSRLAFKLDDVNPAGQMEPLLLSSQNTPFAKKGTSPRTAGLLCGSIRTLVPLIRMMSFGYTCGFDLKNLPCLYLWMALTKKLESCSNS